MQIQLPIPIYKDNEVLSKFIEIKKPNTGCIADTKKIYDSGDQYGAIHHFVSSCTEEVYTETGSITDKGLIKSVVRNMPYRSAEYAFIQIMLLRHSDDGVEGVYYCPRCGHQVVCEAKKEGGLLVLDTRDFIHKLPVTMIEGLSNIDYTMEYPIEISTTEGKLLTSIESLVMRHPTLGDAIMGVKRADRKDDLRSQFGIYVEAIVSINGVDIDNSWRNNYGMIAFDRIDPDTDLIQLTKKVNEFGIEKRVERTCPNCSKTWRSIVNTSNFFELEAQLG
jgi:ssDNA-binding Zn-finger/Zn-ribbon topoisomerase 1